MLYSSFRSLLRAIMSCGCECVSCNVVMSEFCTVVTNVWCLCLANVGLVRYWLPSPACVFQVVIVVGGGLMFAGGGCMLAR